jgi:arginine exporter protein ArgO
MIPLMLILRLFPWLTNLPIKITEENAEYQYTLVVRLMSLMACVVSLLFLALIYDTISIAGGGTSLLGGWFMPLFAGGIIGSLLWYFILVFKGR